MATWRPPLPSTRSATSPKAFAIGSGDILVATDPLGNQSGYAHAGNLALSRDPYHLGETCTYDLLHRKITCADRQEQAELTQRNFTYNLQRTRQRESYNG